VLFHVGYYKTATTTLQNGYFQFRNGIVHLGKPYRDDAVRLWLRALARRDSLLFDQGASLCEWQAIRDRHGGSGDVLTLSDELLLSHAANDRGLIARRLHEVEPDARILVTIREQKALLVSMFLYEARGAKQKGLDAWLDFNLRYFDRGIFPNLDYFAVWKAYSALFGNERVLVLPLELLARAPDTFYWRLDRFLGLPEGDQPSAPVERHENRRMTARQAVYNTLRARLAPGVSLRSWLPSGIAALGDRFLSRGPAARLSLPPAVAARCDGLYAEGNRALAASTGLDLAEFGYAMAVGPAVSVGAA
jgi:hypothetical protein